MLCMLSGCEENTEPAVYPPTLVTGTASEVTRFEATLSGTAVKHPSGTADCEIGFMVSESQSMSDAVLLPGTTATAGNNQYTGKAKGLEPGKSYYFCLYALSGNAVVKGEAQTFQTEESIPPVLTEPVIKSFNESSAVLSSRIADEGGYEITAKGFVYKVFVEGSSDPTTEDIIVPVPLLSEEFTAEALELQPSTNYIVRAYATNKTGTGYSEAIPLNTDKLKIPVVSIEPATDLTAYTAIVNGSIMNDQKYPVTEQGFCWSAESRQPTIDGKHIAAVATDGKFTAIAGADEPLLPHTRYYLRAYAINEKGTGYSSAIEFTTEELQMASLTRMSISDITLTSVTLTARVEQNEGTEIYESGFCWSETERVPDFTNASTTPATADNGQLSATVTGLNEGKTYFATAYAATRDGFFYSEPIEFKTEATSTPALSTPTIADIEETAATVQATITSEGGDAVTTRGICWSATNQAPAIDDAGSTSGTDAESSDKGILYKMNNLTKGTKYYVRAYAQNKNGIAYSGTAEFTTAETFAPTMGKIEVTDVNENGGKVIAIVTSDGGAVLQETGVCYSTDKQNPTVEDMKVTATTPANNINVTLSGLTKGRTYYLRAYAINRNGTSYSQPIVLTTTKNKVPTVSSLTITDINDDNARARAFISDNGGAEVTARGFVWSIGKGSEPTLQSNNGSSPSATSGNDLEAALTSLSYSTDYVVRAYATNAEGTGYSSPIGFVTGSSSVPEMSTNTEHNRVVSYTAYTAVINASINNDGGAAISEVGVYYGTYGENDKKISQPYTGNSFTINLTELKHQTQYHVQPYAKNKNGEALGVYLSFTTEKLPPSVDDNPLPDDIVTGKKPSVSSPSATGTFPTRLELTASVTDNGGHAITAKGFVWSLESDPVIGKEGCTQIDLTQTEGNTMRTVIQNLTPDTHYYVASYATNEKGTTYSYSSFRTEADKPEPDEGDNPTPDLPKNKTQISK